MIDQVCIRCCFRPSSLTASCTQHLDPPTSLTTHSSEPCKRVISKKFLYTMTVRLRASPAASPSSPFSWDNVPITPPLPSGPSTPGSPPTQWLSAPDMKVFGAEPLKSSYAVVKCRDCGKPVLESAIGEHAGKRTYIWVMILGHSAQIGGIFR